MVKGFGSLGRGHVLGGLLGPRGGKRRQRLPVVFSDQLAFGGKRPTSIVARGLCWWSIPVYQGDCWVFVYSPEPLIGTLDRCPPSDPNPYTRRWVVLKP